MPVKEYYSDRLLEKESLTVHTLTLSTPSVQPKPAIEFRQDSFWNKRSHFRHTYVRSGHGLTMLAVLNASPGKVVTPFAKLNTAPALAANDHVAFNRWIVNTPRIAILLPASPIVGVVSTFARIHLAPTERTLFLIGADQLL